MGAMTASAGLNVSLALPEVKLQKTTYYEIGQNLGGVK